MQHSSTKLEILIGRHGRAWRLYAHGWVAPYVAQKLDKYGEALVGIQPDDGDLEEYMWGLDAPYLHSRTTDGGLMITTHGRSTIVLWEWLCDQLSAPLAH